MRHARRISSPLFAVALGAALALGSAALAPSVAHADEVTPTGKGIAGGALLGAEIVTIPMALFNVESGAAYAIGAGVGAVGGGVGGYFIEQSVDDGQIPVYMLAGGLALVIPSIVLVLNATTYKPIEGAREDRAPSGPPADPGAVGGSVVIGAPPAGSSPAPAAAPAPASGTTPTPPAGSSGGGGQPKPTSLLNFREGLRVGLPVPEVRAMVSQADQKRLGVSPGGTEVRMPLVRVTF